MPDNTHADVVRELRQRYSKLFRAHGDGPISVEWSDGETQERRMQVLCEAGNLKNAKVLDFGCGTGHLLTLMKKDLEFAGEYVGYEITPELLEAAREKHPGVRFEARNILEDGLEEEFDFVLISGVFNNLVGDNWDWMTTILETLFSKTRVALAFNNLTCYVDYFDDHLFYVDPARVFQFCKETLSPRVTLRHDYFTRDGTLPYEFTTYVYVTDIEPRKLNAR